MCILKIFSNSDSFRSFAASTALPVYSVRNAQDIRNKTSGKRWDVYRISFDVSDREWNDFPGQVEDAIEFLKKHGSAIRAVIEAHDVSSAYLDFPVTSRLSETIVNQNDHLPAELIRLCGEVGLGIEMAMYATSAFESPPTANDSDSAYELGSDNQ